MKQNRPWSIWWDFRWENNILKWVVVQTDHPQYKHFDYIMKFAIEECLCDKGFIDSWVEMWYTRFIDDIYSGRKSLHEIMKQSGNKRNE